MKSAISTRPRVVLVTRAIVINNGKILLIKRHDGDCNEPLMWEIPGGKLDKGQDLTGAAEREIIEEVGLYATPINQLVFFESTVNKLKKYKGLPYICLASLYKSNSSHVRLSGEHVDYKWVDFEEALKMELTDFTRKSLLAWEEEIAEYISGK